MTKISNKLTIKLSNINLETNLKIREQHQHLSVPNKQFNLKITNSE